MATSTLSNEEILEAIGSKSVVELADLIEAFKTKFNVSVVAAAAPAAGGAAGGAAPVEEKTEYAVVLKEGGAKKIQVIKVVREITSLGLKEAKDAVDNTPSTLKEGISKAEAEEIKKKLEDQGAVVELKSGWECGNGLVGRSSDPTIPRPHRPTTYFSETAQARIESRQLNPLCPRTPRPRRGFGAGAHCVVPERAL